MYNLSMLQISWILINFWVVLIYIQTCKRQSNFKTAIPRSNDDDGDDGDDDDDDDDDGDDDDGNPSTFSYEISTLHAAFIR